MAVLGNSEGSAVPPEMQQTLEVDDDYNKYTPSADYSTCGRVFRNKKFTKKRHESKARRTEQETPNVCCSDEDYPQSNPRRGDELRLHQNIPKMMLTINQTIKKMTLKDSGGGVLGAVGGGVENLGTVEVVGGGGEEAKIFEDSSANLEVDDCQHQSVGQSNSNHSSFCNLQPQPQGKRRRHRRKQQYKRMAVDVLNDKKSIQLKIPTSNSSEDSGIGKRKRNIVVPDNFMQGSVKSPGSGAASIAVPVQHTFGGDSSVLPEAMWQYDDTDAVMMDCDDMESSGATNFVNNLNSQGTFITEDESGESDTQNDDLESFSDHNQDADDEESDYYNNDSSTTSLSESSFTILSPSKKFIPVHSREIRCGRRRLKNTNFSSIENDGLSKFMQNPKDTVLKVCPSSEKERQDFKNVASLYSLSYEEGCDQEDRMWIQVTKTTKTTQRRNDLLKAADRSSFNFSEGPTLAPMFDSIASQISERGEISDERIGDIEGTGGTSASRSCVGVNQVVNSKRIKKGC